MSTVISLNRCSIAFQTRIESLAADRPEQVLYALRTGIVGLLLEARYSICNQERLIYVINAANFD